MDDVDMCDTTGDLVDTKTNDKLQKILWKLLEPDFKIKNDLYLNLLLTQWANKTAEGVLTRDGNQKINELFYQWIIAATNSWEKSKFIPSSSVLLFAINVCCQLSTNERFFVEMSGKKVFQKLAEISQQDENHTNSSVTVGFITLLSSVLEYAIGVEWLLTTTYWNDIINIAMQGRTKYIKKKSYQFIIKLLETTVLLDQAFCEELVEMLVEPLSEAAIHIELKKDLEKEKNMYETLKPSLDLILEVADTLLKKFNKNILSLFFETEISEAIQNILSFSHMEDFSLDLLKLRFAFLFYQLCVKLEGNQQATHDEDTLSDIRVMFDLIQAEIEKGHESGVIKICYYANVLYCNLDTRIPLCIRKGESIEFQNQMMLLQLVPVMSFSFQLIGLQKSKQLLWTDDLRHDFYMKFSKISAIKTLEIVSRWEERLAGKYDLIEDVGVSLQHIIKSKKLMKKEQAAFIFRPLIYCIKDISHRLKDYTETTIKLRGIRFVDCLIDTIIDLVESFHLTWKDSLETISVLDLASDIVQYELLDYQVTVKFLQLLDMAISRCMSPNMTLLMDNSNDRAISQVGNLLYSKCHNKSHQIRNHALKVVCTIADNARTKFPEFTNILFNAELPQLVVEMALKDKEHEVRASALKCMQAMILVENIWNVYQSDHNLWDNIFNILVKEPKGTVRKEAAKLVYDIHLSHSCPEKLLPRLYDIMTHAAIADLHWEVKLNALNFWGLTLKNHLIVQGMVDKNYPTHIFSKEKKKIIALTEDEIRRRVVKVLYQLSEIGCLYVLKTAVHDKFDEEVSKTAMVLVRNTVRMCNNRKITPADVNLDRPLSPARSNASNTVCLDSQSNPDRCSSLESSYQSQYPDSPCSTNSSLSPAPVFSEDSSSSSDYALASPGRPTMNNNSPLRGVRKIKKHESHPSIVSDQELDMFDFFNTEKYFSVLENDDIGLPLEEDSMEKTICEMADTEKMFDEMLKLNNATLLEEICNPGYESTKGNKTKDSKKDEELAELLHVREVVCARLDRFDKYLRDKISRNVLQIKLRLKSVEDDFTEFDRCQTRIEFLSPDESRNRLNIEDLFYKTISFAKTILNSEDQQSETAPRLKTKEYLAPSEYVKFCFDVVESSKPIPNQLTQGMDEFDSLLNDLVKEYDLSSTTLQV